MNVQYFPNRLDNELRTVKDGLNLEVVKQRKKFHELEVEPLVVPNNTPGGQACTHSLTQARPARPACLPDHDAIARRARAARGVPAWDVMEAVPAGDCLPHDPAPPSPAVTHTDEEAATHAMLLGRLQYCLNKRSSERKESKKDAQGQEVHVCPHTAGIAPNRECSDPRTHER